MADTPFSINHCNSKEQQALIKLKNIIVSRCRPLLIYCLGSSSFEQVSRNCFHLGSCIRQWFFSCDILIVLPSGTVVPPEVILEIENTSGEFEHINLIVHDFDFVAMQLRRYSLFFCWLQQYAMLLYDKDSTSLKLPYPLRNLKQYALQAEEYFAHHPQYDQYEVFRLSPLPDAALVHKRVD